MKTKIRISVLTILLLVPYLLMSQTGTLKGVVTNNSDSSPIPYVNVYAVQNGNVVSATTTNFDGKYTIKGLPVGKYTIKADYVGYESNVFKNVKINANKITFLNISLNSQIEILEMVEMREPPMVSNDVRAVLPGRAYNKKVKCASMGYAQYNNFNTESYDYISENGFKSPLNSPLSTFSIDVDAASYSNVRRNLNQGNLPPVDAVRVEEMINYFTYNYKAPTNKPFSIYTEVTECAWNPKHKLAMIGIHGKVIDMKNAKPSNLVFLLDVSGSMYSQNKLPLLKKSLKLLVNQLSKKDKVSIVVYAGSAGLVLDATTCDNKEKIFEALENLQAGGSTAGGAGIKLAYKVAKENFISNGNNRIILATDGDFNIGASSDAEMQRLIEKQRESGVFITVLGFGMGNYKDSKMEKIADNGNGNYAYIDNLLEAQKVLVNEIGGTLLTIAKDVKLQVEFNPANVQSYRLIGYENRLLNDEDFNDDKKDAGELGAGKTVTALYEIIPTGVKSEFSTSAVDELKYQKSNDKIVKSDELFTVKIRYKTPKGSVSELITKVVKNKAKSFDNASKNLRFATAVAEFGMLLRNSKYKGTSSYKSISKIAYAAKGKDEEGYRSEFIKLVKLAENIDNRQFSEK